VTSPYATQIDVGGVAEPLDTVTAIDVKLPNSSAERANVSLRGARASACAQTLFLVPVMDMRNTFVAGFVTARLAVVFASGQTAVFDVYNDRLGVQDSVRSGYYLGPGWADIISEREKGGRHV
jgi:hypothetical protein